MPLDKGKIIERAFFNLGQNTIHFSSNLTDEQNVADRLLDYIVDRIAYDEQMFGNATTVTLEQKDDETSILGEIRYLIPVDYLGLITFNNNAVARLEGQYIYSSEGGISMTYLRKIQLLELPMYYEDYLVYSLALDLAKAYTQYEDKAQLMIQMQTVARRKIYNQEGLAFEIEV